MVTDADPQTTVELISKLLAKRSIKHSIVNNHISSTHIPFIILGFDWRRYSRDNFIGYNPFVFIDKIKINVESDSEKKTKLDITVIQVRSYVPIIIMILIILKVRTVEFGTFAAIIFAIIAVLYYLFAFHLVIGHLLTSEIKRVLKSNERESKSQ